MIWFNPARAHAQVRVPGSHSIVPRYRISPVLLNGWKEIAGYLKCGVRTVQRWEQLGLPVMRVRPGNRGPVMAHSESIDSWIKTRTARVKYPQRADIAATIEKTKAIHEMTMHQLRVLLTGELSAGLTLAKSALQTGNPTFRARRTALARQAYDTIIRLSPRIAGPGLQVKGFAADLDRLAAALRKLGEKL